MTRRKSINDEIDQFHEYGIHVPTRTIKLDLDEGEIESDVEVGPKSASRLIKNLVLLESLSQDPITILMNCPGGSVVDGLAMYDAIRSCKSHVTIKVLGEASSMAVWILQAADERVAYPFSRFMLHEGGTYAEGHAIDVERAVEHDKYWRYKFYKVLSDRCGRPSKYWSRKISRDWFLSAEQALSEKIIDRIEGQEVVSE